MASGPPLDARLFGEPAFGWGGETFEIGPKKPRALLLYLSVETARGEGAAREHLAELLWGAGKLANVRQALYELRKLPGADAWLDDGDAVRVRASCDVVEFDRACDRGDFDVAVALASAPLAAGFDVPGAAPFREWLEAERARLAERLREAQVAALDVRERRGRLDDALELARTLLADDPLNETAHRAAMRLEHARGDTAAALEQFERLRELLADELGVEPVPETLELLRAIERGEGAAAYLARLLQRPDDTPERPERLLGRDEDVAAVAAHLDAGGALLLHGFGGIGKSAVAAEGVARWLDEGERTALWIEAGSAPPEELLEALARPFRADAEVARSGDPGATLLEIAEGAGVGALVLDDARSAYTVAKLRELTAGRLALLVVSRQRYPAIERRTLGRLARAAALELLALHAETELEPGEAEALAATLGDHPYALRLAGVTLRRQELTPSALRERIERRPHALELVDEGPADRAARVAGAPPEEGESVAALLEVSLDPLDDGEYEAFLGFGALFAPQVGPELLAALLRRPLDDVEDALFALVRGGLAERVAAPGTDAVAYRVHDLAHSYARVDAFWRPRSLVRAAVEVLRELRHDPEAVERDLPNLLGAAEGAAPAERVELLRLLAVQGAYFLARGHSRRSVALLERAAEDAGRLGDAASQHDLLGRLGDAHADHLGDVGRALTSYRRAFEVAEAEGDRARAAVYAGLTAQMLVRRGEGETESESDADAWLERAAERARGADALTRCIVAEQRGVVAGTLGDMERANRALAEAADLAAQLEPGPELRPYEVVRRRFYATLNLGETERALGRVQASLEHRRAALAMAEEVGNPLWVAHVHLELGETYHTARSELPDAALPDAAELALRHLEAAWSSYRHLNARSYRMRTERFMLEHGYDLPAEEAGAPEDAA